MPVTPYSQPLNYEYKPLNLSAFAQPLKEMQQKFDLTQTAIEDARNAFDLSHLPYGTDPERAKALLATVQGKADELAENLSKTKNYTQAVSKIKRLQKLWQEDPEKAALEANFKTWTERDKAERERIDNGKDNSLTRNQYEQWRADEIAKYEEGNGASFKASADNPEGTYRTVTGITGRLGDQEKELEKKKEEIAKLYPEQISTYFKQNGVSLTDDERVSLEQTIKSKDANKIARLTEEYVRKIPRFKEWGEEVAKYNYLDTTKRGTTENVNKVGEELVNNTLKSIDRQLASQSKAEGFKGSETEADLLDLKQQYEEIKASGEYDPKLVQELYTQKHMNDIYGSQEIGNVLAYRNVINNYSIRRNPEWEAARRAADNPFKVDAPYVAAEADKPLSIPSMQENIKTSKNSLRTGSVTNTNDLVEGTVRKVVAADKNWNDVGGMYERQKTIRDAIVKGYSYEQFKKVVKSNHVMAKSSDEDLRKVYNTFKGEPGKTNYALQSLNDNLTAGEIHYNNYINDKENLRNVRTVATESKEFQKFAHDFGNVPQLQKQEGSDDPALQAKKVATNTMFNANTYSEADLKKAGINLNTLPEYRDKITGKTYKPLSLNQVAKIKGFKDVTDAYIKGYNFEGLSVMSDASWEEGKYNKNVTNLGTAPQSVQAWMDYGTMHLSDKTNNVQQMAYRLNSAPTVGTILKDQFKSVDDILKETSLKGQPGFDENGNAEPGTKIDYNNGKKPSLVFHGNQTMVAIPMVNADKQSYTVTIPVRHPENYDRVFKEAIALNQGNDELSVRTRNTLYNQVFELRYPGSGIIQTKADNLKVDGSNKTVALGTIQNAPVGTGTLELRKVYRENANPEYQWKDVNTNEWVPGIYKSVQSAREIMGEASSGY